MLLTKYYPSWTHDRKVAGLISGGAVENLILQIQLFVLSLVSVSIPPVIAVACKRPLSFAKNAGGRLQLNTHAPFTQPSHSGLIMPLSRHSVGT